MKTNPATIDEYIAGFPEDVQKYLQQMRATIRKAAPAAEETINYAIPTFKLNGNLVHFAAFKNHIGFLRTMQVRLCRTGELMVNFELRFGRMQDDFVVPGRYKRRILHVIPQNASAQKKPGTIPGPSM